MKTPRRIDSVSAVATALLAAATLAGCSTTSGTASARAAGTAGLRLARAEERAASDAAAGTGGAWRSVVSPLGDAPGERDLDQGAGNPLGPTDAGQTQVARQAP